eukprot:SAG11_NODE_1272_length_5334_cov_11.636676_2_plen_70_part_00
MHEIGAYDDEDHEVPAPKPLSRSSTVVAEDFSTAPAPARPIDHASLVQEAFDGYVPDHPSLHDFALSLS